MIDVEYCLVRRDYINWYFAIIYYHSYIGILQPSIIYIFLITAYG
jgi:hypothetical protein